jgi:hypothetical protein
MKEEDDVFFVEGGLLMDPPDMEYNVSSTE